MISVRLVERGKSGFLVFIKQVKITKLVNVYKSCSVVHLEGVLVREVIL